MSRPVGVRAQDLDPEAFAPFGSVITADDGGRRFWPAAVDCAADRRLVLSTTRATPSPGLPVTIDRLERHPHSAQTFLPFDVERWLVVVGLEPDPSALAAFWVGPGIGVTIGRNVWHHGLTVVGRAADFAVLMGRDGPSGSPADDEWIDIEPARVIS